MIGDLDQSLEALLARDLPELLGQAVSISFETPDDDFGPRVVAFPAIDLFLYDIRENLELRSKEWHVDRRENGRADMSRSPIRADFSYLVTAWAGEGVAQPARDEHRMLGAVMSIMARYPTIPTDVAAGALSARSVPIPVTLHSGHLPSIGDFWQALGGKPKAAINVTVTLAVDLPAPAPVPVVRDSQVRVRMRKGSK